MSVTAVTEIAMRFVLAGRVQGLGVRPAVARLAGELGLAGRVWNDCDGITIFVEGPPDVVESFERLLASRLPRETRVERRDSCPAVPVRASGFEIVERMSAGPLAARLPPDTRVCDRCLAETRDRGNRRHRYPFTGCAQCGPRYSILAGMPYERRRTSMAAFTQCESCLREYRDPADARFHAQTNACPKCGPHVWCADRDGNCLAAHHDAVRLAARALRDGQIVALRGLGGYQVLCDATNRDAVDRLRLRKRRTAKPFAVMIDSLESAQALAEIDSTARTALDDPANPIVLLRAKPTSSLAPSVHPGLDTIGLMLPTTPLHSLILEEAGRPLIATSGNPDGEPLAAAIEESGAQLAEIADLWLHHDREIANAIDDSVVRVIAERPVTIRLARGLATLPLDVQTDRCLLALGAHQKGAIAFSNGRQAILGPHLGDLDSAAARERFERHVHDMSSLLGAKPEVLVHDLHPDYFSTRWAAEQMLPTMAVQHHHAHIVAGMLEHGWLDREVLGVAFDGTGFGVDGTIWGGEFLRCTAAAADRVAHLRPFPLPGGEAAVREPWRVAAALLHAINRQDAFPRLERASAKEHGFERLLRLVENRPLSPLTTSAGRLFDAAAALILGIDRAESEGLPAMRLEAACDPSDERVYRMAIGHDWPRSLDWKPLLEDLLADLAAGAAAGAMAMRFHRALARGIAATCRLFPDLPVVLCGGVFQNRILCELVAGELSRAGRPVGSPGRIPPNDGGIAAGQLAVAAARLQDSNGQQAQLRRKPLPCV